MLPPKLAQIIINLAVGLLPDEARRSVCDVPPDEPIPLIHFNKTLLDPFCGTGVVLQEALLMGYQVYGTDIDKRLVSYSSENLAWLIGKYPDLKKTDVRLTVADATTYQWQSFDVLASEINLGKPFSTTPPDSDLITEITKCNNLLEAFLINLRTQLKPKTKICLALPAWQVNPGIFKSLPLIDRISDLGYNLVQFKSVNSARLIYARPGQIVARELLTLTRE